MSSITASRTLLYLVCKRGVALISMYSNSNNCADGVYSYFRLSVIYSIRSESVTQYRVCEIDASNLEQEYWLAERHFD